MISTRSGSTNRIALATPATSDASEPRIPSIADQPSFRLVKGASVSPSKVTLQNPQASVRRRDRCAGFACRNRNSADTSLTVIGRSGAKAGFALLIKELALRMPTTPSRLLVLGSLKEILSRGPRNNDEEHSETQNVWRWLILQT